MSSSTRSAPEQGELSCLRASSAQGLPALRGSRCSPAALEHPQQTRECLPQYQNLTAETATGKGTDSTALVPSKQPQFSLGGIKSKWFLTAKRGRPDRSRGSLINPLTSLTRARLTEPPLTPARALTAHRGAKETPRKRRGVQSGDKRTYLGHYRARAPQEQRVSLAYHMMCCSCSGTHDSM